MIFIHFCWKKDTLRRVNESCKMHIKFHCCTSLDFVKKHRNLQTILEGFFFETRSAKQFWEMLNGF